MKRNRGEFRMKSSRAGPSIKFKCDTFAYQIAVTEMTSFEPGRRGR